MNDLINTIRYINKLKFFRVKNSKEGKKKVSQLIKEKTKINVGNHKEINLITVYN